MHDSATSNLKIIFDRTPAGKISADQHGDVLIALQAAWSEIEGGRETRMEDYKLERAESFTWRPPLLSFVVERHGGAALGSTRAERQKWIVDVEHAHAHCEIVGFRQNEAECASAEARPDH